jgi:histidinol-phosphate aminotransferase
MLSWQQYIRPHILKIKAYSSARDEFSGAAKVFLDANENPFDQANAGWNRYPDPHQLAIKQKLSYIKQVPAEQIFIGNGSDEAIDLLYRIFCEPGKDAVITCPPTYGMYGVSAAIHNVENVLVPLTTGYQLNTKAIIEAANERTKMLFICSPNNPTGNSLKVDDITFLLQNFKGIVVVDEAYIDFSAQESWTSALSQYDNLVVMQTMSKAWGLASVRLGMAFAHVELIAVLDKVKPPYNISGPNQKIVLAALLDEDKVKQQVSDILAQREWLASQLAAVKEVKKIHPTDANFLLVEVNDAHQKYKQLLEKGVVVRDRSNVTLCGDCLRITVGTEEENEQLVEVLAALLD